MLLVEGGGARIIDFFVLFLPDCFLGDQLYRSTIYIWLFLFLAYFPVLDGYTGYSVGKYIFRVRVVNKYGESPGLLKSIVRALLRLIEVNPILFGGIPAGLVALFSERSHRLGDMLASTYVASSSLIEEYNQSNQSDAKKTRASV